MDLRKLQADPAAFRDVLSIDSDGGSVRLGSVLDPWQRSDFAALDSGWRRVAGHTVDDPCLRAYLERPRGHSKTSDLAAIVAWVLFASCRRLSGVAAAADKDQARLLRTAVEKLVRANAWLGSVLEVQTDKILNLHTGSELEILSSDAATSYGLTPDFVIVDELTHWKKRDLWDSLFSAAAKRSHCLLIIISNAGFGDTWQWETREAVRRDPNWHFSRLDGPQASWISQKILAEQRRLLPPVAFDRLWLNRWTAGAGDALREADIRSALTLAGPLVAPEPGWCYVAGLDLGLSRDASALTIVGRHVGYAEERELPQPAMQLSRATMADLGLIDGFQDRPEFETTYHEGTGRQKLARVCLWRPEPGRKVSVEAIELTILALHEALGLACVGYDPYQAEYLAERLRKAGLGAEPVQFTPANLQSMATSTLEAFTERQLDLYPDPSLVTDLHGLRVAERAYGFRLESPRGASGHGDSATALSIALHTAKKFARFGSHVQGELLCYP